MTSYDDWYPSNYFKADDVIDNPLFLTVADIHRKKCRTEIQSPLCSSKRTSAAWC